MKKIYIVLFGLSLAASARDEIGTNGGAAALDSVLDPVTVKQVQRADSVRPLNQVNQESFLSGPRNAANHFQDGQVEFYERTKANPNMKPEELQSLKRELIDERHAAIQRALQDSAARELKSAGIKSSLDAVDFSQGKGMTTDQYQREMKEATTEVSDSSEKTPEVPKAATMENGSIPIRRAPAAKLDHGPSEPEVVLDGSSIPKEIHYPGKDPGKNPGKKTGK